MISVQVNIDSPNCVIFDGGLPNMFRCKQVHFHWGSNMRKGSEHTINGQSYPVEVQYNYSIHEPCLFMKFGIFC